MRTNYMAVLVISVTVLSLSAFATHTPNATLVPEWTPGNSNVSYTVTIGNEGGDPIKEFRILQNTEYENLTCPDTVAGWGRSYVDPVVNPDGDVTSGCLYVNTDSSQDIEAGQTLDFPFTSESPDTEACSLKWYFETRDSEMIGSGTWQTVTETTGIDNTAPNYDKEVNGPQAELEGSCPPASGEACHVTQDTTISVNVSDPGAKECTTDDVTPSEMDYCNVSVTVDGEKDDSYTETYQANGNEVKFDVQFEEDSVHNLSFVCKDNAGNKVEDTETFKVDDTPPVTSQSFDGPTKEDDGRTWIDTVTDISLSSSDPNPAPEPLTCHSGVDSTYYRWQQVDEQFCEAEPSKFDFEKYQRFVDLNMSNVWYVNGLDNESAEEYESSVPGNQGQWQYVTGPATPPLGKGSLQLSIDNAGVAWRSFAHRGTDLSDIDTLQYSTYSENGNAYPTLQLEWDEDCELNGYDGNLVYLPSNNTDINGNPAQAGTWQTWDATEGTWTVSSDFSKSFTWSELQSMDACLRPDFGRLGVKLGTANTEETAYTDQIVFNDKTYDLEPQGSFLVSDGSTIDIPEESCHVLEYYSRDTLNNEEPVNREFFYVDKTSPAFSKTFGEQTAYNESDLEQGGDGVAQWFDGQASQGQHSALLSMPGSPNKSDFAGVDSFFDVFVSLDNISNVTYDRKVTNAGSKTWTPLVVLGIDANDDGEFDAQPLEWQASGFDPAKLQNDSFLQCEASSGLSGTDSEFVTVSAFDTFNCYTPNASGTGWTGYDPLSYYQNNDVGRLTSTDGVAMLKVMLNYPAAEGETALVDNVKLNGDTVIDEPNGIWVTTDTDVDLSCNDPQPHPAGDEKLFYRYRVDNGDGFGDWQGIDCDQTTSENWCRIDSGQYELNFPETSTHELQAYCEDAVKKQSAVDTEVINVDDEKPLLSKEVKGPQQGQCPPPNGGPSNCSITEDTKVIVNVTDNESIHASNQVTCAYTVDYEEAAEPIDTGTFGTEGKVFQWDQDSNHTLELTCRDAVDNTLIDTETFRVDKTPPTTTEDLGEPFQNQLYPKGCVKDSAISGDFSCNYASFIRPFTPVNFTAEDEKSGVKDTFFKVDRVNDSFCANAGSECVPADVEDEIVGKLDWSEVDDTATWSDFDGDYVDTGNANGTDAAKAFNGHRTYEFAIPLSKLDVELGDSIKLGTYTLDGDLNAKHRIANHRPSSEQPSFPWFDSSDWPVYTLQDDGLSVSVDGDLSDWTSDALQYTESDAFDQAAGMNISHPYDLYATVSGDTLYVGIDYRADTTDDVTPDGANEATDSAKLIFAKSGWETFNGTAATAGKSSCHRFSYYSVDILGNQEAPKASCAFVDDTAPDVNKSIGDPSIFKGEGTATSSLASGCVTSDTGGPVSPASLEGGLAVNDSCTVTKNVTTGETATAKNEIYFLVDSTGSMSGSISNVQTNINSILDSVDADFGAGQYKDFESGDSFAFQNEQVITTDQTAVESAINSLSASGGGDGDEGQFYALEEIAESEAGFSSDATKTVVWFGDAPGHDPICSDISGEPDDITQSTVIDKLKDAGIKVIAISVTDSGPGMNAIADDDYPGCDAAGTSNQASQIADATGGVHISGVDSSAVTDAIKDAINETTSTTDVVPDASACTAEGINVSFTPDRHEDVASLTRVQFDETVTRTASANGTVTCDVKFRSGDEGGVIGTQTLTVGPTGDVNSTGADWFVSQDTPITLTCKDKGEHPADHVTLSYRKRVAESCAGVAGASWSNWTKITNANSSTYTLNHTFSFAEDSCHELQYTCEDGVGNAAANYSEIDVVDTQPPVTELDFLNQHYEVSTDSGTVDYIDTNSSIELTADDPEPHPSGVNNTEYRWSLANDKFCNGTDTSEFTSPREGFEQGFEEDRSGWFDYLGSEVSRAVSGTDGVPSATGSYHATLSLGDIGSGPYSSVHQSAFTRWGGYENTFPDGGYTTSVDVYLDTARADGTVKKLSFSSAVNNPSGSHEKDFIIHISSDTTPGRFVVSSSNNAPGSPTANSSGDAESIDQTGWYTFEHTFRNESGNLEVTYEVTRKSDGAVIYNRTQLNSEQIGTDVGGNRYGWFAVNDFADLPIDNSRLTGDKIVSWKNYTGPFSIPKQSCHAIQYRSADNLDNEEAVNTEFVFVDKSAPEITKEYDGGYFTDETAEWINAETLVNLTTSDVEPHPSGVDDAEYRVTLVNDSACRSRTACQNAAGNGSFTSFEGVKASFPIAEESCHLIEARSTDNVGKQGTHEQCVFVDDTGPVTNKTVEDPVENMTPAEQELGSAFYSALDNESEDYICDEGSDKCLTVTELTQMDLACSDEGPHPSGTQSIKFKVGLDGDDVTERYCENVTEGTYDETTGYCTAQRDSIEQFRFTEESWHRLEYACTDRVGNEGETDVEYFKVEGTAFNLSLNKKWNLISTPVRLQDNALDTVMEGHEDSVVSTWTYHNGTWSVHTPDGVDNDNLETMKPGWGYWVLTNESDSLSIGGSLFSPATTPPQKPVHTGWNLIGYYGSEGETQLSAPQQTSPVGSNGRARCELNTLYGGLLETPVTSMLTYWEGFNTPGSDPWIPMSVQDDQMDPGFGYWIYYSGDTPRISYAPSDKNCQDILGVDGIA